MSVQQFNCLDKNCLNKFNSKTLLRRHVMLAHSHLMGTGHYKELNVNQPQKRKSVIAPETASKKYKPLGSDINNSSRSSPGPHRPPNATFPGASSSENVDAVLSVTLDENVDNSSDFLETSDIDKLCRVGPSLCLVRDDQEIGENETVLTNDIVDLMDDSRQNMMASSSENDIPSTSGQVSLSCSSRPDQTTPFFDSAVQMKLSEALQFMKQCNNKKNTKFAYRRGQLYKCPLCFFDTYVGKDFSNHIRTHQTYYSR